MPTDNRSLLERLRALQGQQQGTPDSQLGLQQSMNRMRQRMNPVDNSVPQGPDPSTLPPREGMPEGAPTAASHAAAQAAVDAMNARIKANDDAQTAGYPQGNQRNQAADYLTHQPKVGGMAEGGMVDDKFPRLKKRFGK